MMMTAYPLEYDAYHNSDIKKEAIPCETASFLFYDHSELHVLDDFVSEL